MGREINVQGGEGGKISFVLNFSQEGIGAGGKIKRLGIFSHCGENGPDFSELGSF